MRVICFVITCLISIVSFSSQYPSEIYGGTEVTNSIYDSTVLLIANLDESEKPFCTGVLVQEDMILTAAHCIANNRLRPVNEKVKVMVGNKYSQEKEFFKIKEAVYHPDFFKSQEEINDIAYIILERPISIPSSLIPYIPTNRSVTKNILVKDYPSVLVGFGYDEEGNVGTKLMAETNFVEMLPSSELVIGGNGKDSCDGDSGGPAYMSTENRFYVVGISSRGVDSSPDGCGKGGIYTNIQYHLEWIEKTSARDLSRASHK